MKVLAKSILTLFVTGMVLTSYGQNKYRTFEFTHQINASIDDVWAVMAEKFGEIHVTHHDFVNSDWVGSSEQGGEGAIRICLLDEDSSRYIKEKQINYDPENYSYSAQVIEGKGLPLATGYNIASYQLIKIDENNCEVRVSVKLRSDPPIFGKLFLGQYEDWLKDYIIGVHHYVLTGEAINADNFKSIKKKYKS